MDQAEVQAVIREFAAPLAGYVATSAQRKEGAEHGPDALDGAHRWT